MVVQRRRGSFIEQPCGEDTLLLAPDGAVHRLDPLAWAVWKSADGQSGLDELLALAREVDPAADKSLLFEALDRLADVGLLEARVGPPAGCSRRVLVRSLVGVSAAAALATFVGMPGAAAAEGCDDELVAALERLAAEQTAVGAELDGMVEAALEAEAVKIEDVAALSAQEAAAKADALGFEELGHLAEVDATECRTKADDAARTKLRDQAMKLRQEMQTKRASTHAESHQKRVKAVTAREQQAKATLGASEQKEKAKGSKEQQQKSLERHQERTEKHKARHQAALTAREEHHKRQATRVEERHKQHQQRYAPAKAKLKERLVRQEEAEKAKSADAARSEATKKAGSVQARVKAIAKERHAKAHQEADTKRKRID